jgi:hypothetical protein
MRCPLPVLAFVFLVGFGGCIVIPTPEHGLLAGRGEIKESDIAFLSVSKTTLEDVLLRFGEPDLVLQDQHILIYHWKVSHGYWFIGGGYSGVGGTIPKDYLFMLEFNGEGRLKRFEISGCFLTSAEDRIDKWTPSGSEKLSGLRREKIFIDPIPGTSSQTVTLDTESRPIRFQVGEFCDDRISSHKGNSIGYKKSAFGVIVAEVRVCRPVIDIVRAAVTRQLQVMGYYLVENEADVVVTGKVTEFGVTTSVNPSTRDAIGSLDVIMEVQFAIGTGPNIVRQYKAMNVSKTVFGPSDENFEQVMRLCLEEMQRQMASDKELATSFSRITN